MKLSVALPIVSLCLVSVLFRPAKCLAAKPNILIILADDFGWGDASCNNPDTHLKTPAIDRIAAEGIRFTNAHTPSAVCSPTRYGLLTGRYPWRSMQDPALARDKVDNLYVAKAISFIEEHETNHRDSPFFVYLPLNAIHGAVTVPARFDGKSELAYREDKILWANESVDKMLATIDRLNLKDDTLVIFTADNGPINSAVTCSNWGFCAICQGKWKAIFGTKWSGGIHGGSGNYGPEPPKGTPPDDPAIGQLYDISSDPFETKDLWESHPEIVEALRREQQRIEQLDKSDVFHP